MNGPCRNCLGCNRMELDGWTEPEYCPSSPDPELRHPPKQMKMEPQQKEWNNGKEAEHIN